MIMGEGGSLDLQMAANILQTLFNRMYYAWNCENGCTNEEWNDINSASVPWASITSDEFISLAEFLASETYGPGIPVYNAWGKSQPRTSSWSATQSAVGRWLSEGPGSDPSMEPVEIQHFGRTIIAHPAVRRRGVMSYYSFDPSDPRIENLEPYDPQHPERNGYVHYDQAQGRVQYYFYRAYYP